METTTSPPHSQIRPSWRGLLGPALAVWAGLAVVAVLNGAFREGVLVPSLGDSGAHVLSTLLLTAAVAVIAALYVSRFARDADRRTLLAVGGLWMVLTLGFEFGFGHYVMGKSWSVLLADYNVLAGRIWVLVPVTLLVAPLIAARYFQRR
ncbi:hypothetical protein [Halapricum hydrolyticum]|uniref:Uncharacterized protein n=1 Tax=Halapricum hydrolyticum TaxID=2979991 RepID=A0AAE3ICD1_9EURY|nr:hypothetical protein [Halapricum hydrolyticum]MCU4719046.1 hypothetical protein [Halapricum hydrolyticum]MCU4728035.1 hypothetical protein [Halapricum hydrolyticum]